MFLQVRNVNQALNTVMEMLTRTHKPCDHSEYSPWRKVSPRSMETLEWKSVFVTEYAKPLERVLFSAARDANPFFHFFESMWILAGRDDVEFLAQFNSKMRDFSDDGVTFHAPYGYRLRYAFGFDQIDKAIVLLKDNHDTRQVVMAIWDPKLDMGKKTKDLPCNDTITLKIRDNKLNMTVFCRSNDLIWGAYGANAVQFSTLQEFIAIAVGVEVGTYTQISDSFHVYTDNDAYKRLLEKPYSHDTYEATAMVQGMHPLMQHNTNHKSWVQQLKYAIEEPHTVEDKAYDLFFRNVFIPLWESWVAYKHKDYDVALKILSSECHAYDWATACHQWIMRRMEKRSAV
jgi:hypothetical protein